MHLEISRGAARLLVALTALALLAVTTLAVVAIPYVPRLAKVAEALPEAAEVVDSVSETQDQVARIDGNVETLTPPVTRATEDLSDLSPQLRKLSGQLAAASEGIAGLEQQLGSTSPNGRSAGLAAQLADVQRTVGEAAVAAESLGEPLAPMATDLHRLAGDTGSLAPALDRLTASTAVLEQLPRYFRQMIRMLEEMTVHVRSLDRKTGPTLR